MPYQGPPRQPTGQYPPGQDGMAQYPPPQNPTAQFSPPQYPTAQFPPPQYPTAQFPPAQYPPPQWPPAQYGQYPQGQWPPPYGAGLHGAWGSAAHLPRRPGTAVAAAVLAFASATLLLFATLFLASFAALLAVVRQPDDVAGPWLVALQLLVAAALATGGALLLAGRWLWVVLADAALLGLSVYWLIVAIGPSRLGDAGPTGTMPLAFGLLALGSGALAALPATRAWSQQRTARTAAPEPAPERAAQPGA